MKQSELIEQLISISKRLNDQAREYQAIDLEKLRLRPNAESWNVLEIFDHLNQYIEIYNQHFADSLKKAKAKQIDKEITRGYFGNTFIKMMEPKEDGDIKKMNTFKSKNPMGKNLDQRVIQQFIDLNMEMIDYLNKSKSLDIQNVKCKLAIPVLKLKLSDAFQFIIAHNQRHFLLIRENLN